MRALIIVLSILTAIVLVIAIIRSRKRDRVDYTESICGYWEPVEGTECRLDINKYYTIIREYPIENEWHKDRHEYCLNNDILIISRGFYNCTIKIIKEGGVTYLEVYGHENYAGKYRKRE